MSEGADLGCGGSLQGKILNRVIDSEGSGGMASPGFYEVTISS